MGCYPLILLIRGWNGDEEEDWKLVLLNEVKENFRQEIKVA